MIRNPKHAYYIFQDMFNCLFLFTEIEGGFYTVKFDSLLLKEAVLEADCLIPPLRQDENSSSSESDDDLDQCDAGYAKGLVSNSTEFFMKCLNPSYQDKGLL